MSAEYDIVDYDILEGNSNEEVKEYSVLACPLELLGEYLQQMQSALRFKAQNPFCGAAVVQRNLLAIQIWNPNAIVGRNRVIRIIALDAN